MTVSISPLPQAFTANEQRVKEMLDQGKKLPQIAYKLHMNPDQCREIIFEIRKKECLMAGKPRLSQEERAEIFRLYRDEHMTQRDLAARFGVSHGTIRNIINSFGSVQEMCDTLAAADAEQKSAIAEPEKIPDVIWHACDDKISMINLDIETREQRIAELKVEIEQLRVEREQIRTWMEKHT